jgi:hypothetical protein
MHANRTHDVFWKVAARAKIADVVHQAGRRVDAEMRFREAEEMQAKSPPYYPLLYSGSGFRYCDLLLAEAERAAWKMQLNSKYETGNSKPIESCREVVQRATQTLQFEEGERNAPILDFAFHHLSLGHAALYRAILEKSTVLSANREVDQAAADLRRSGRLDELPRGLLIRAWLRSLEDNVQGARADLDEAWEIAERGPMRLFMADIHLHRARLLGDKDELKKARAMIEQCGYWRRKEELEDAEEAAENW